MSIEVRTGPTSGGEFRGSGSVAPAGIALGAIPVLIVSASSGLPLDCIVAILLNYLAISTTLSVVPRVTLTPTFAFSVILSIFGLAGYVFYGELVERGLVPSALAVDDEAVRTDALRWFMLASVSTLVGALVVRGAARSSHTVDRPSASSALDGSPRFAISFAVASATLNLAVRDVHDLLERSSYRIDTPIGGFLTYLQLPAAFLLGQCLLRSRWYVKALSLGLMLFFIGFSFALSSRLISVTILMFFTGIGMTLRRYRLIPVAVGVVVAALLLPLPLYLRGLRLQGLLPNLSALGDYQAIVQDGPWEILANLLTSFNTVALTGSVDSIPWSSFINSIFPLPGFFGATNGGSELRINFAVPFSGLGEIANHGDLFLVLVFSVLGLLFGFVERATRAYEARYGETAITMIPLGLAILSGFLFVQYNLSSAIRFQYLLILVGVGLLLRSRPRERVISSSR